MYIQTTEPNEIENPSKCRHMANTVNYPILQLLETPITNNPNIIKNSPKRSINLLPYLSMYFVANKVKTIYNIPKIRVQTLADSPLPIFSNISLEQKIITLIPVN